MKNSIVFLFIISIAGVACSQKQTTTTPTNTTSIEAKPTKENMAAKRANTDVRKISEYIDGKDYSAYKVATFAGGCFWCTEASFERINGVVDVISGYSGGKESYPTYKEVSYGRTTHAEAIQVYYDPAVINFDKLLDVFFVAHDPTTLNRQGPDKGPHYRSAIYYHNDTQKDLIDKKIKDLTAANAFRNPIVTEVAAYEEFWTAEAYHQDY